MKIPGPFSKDDLLLVKWHILLALVSLSLAIGIYMAAGDFRSGINTGLIVAQRDFRNAQQQLDQIEQEEATIIEYIGRYLELDADNIVQAEDRLQFLEILTEIRSTNNLFPIALNIEGQRSLQLQYDPQVRDPGGPVNLNVSRVEVRLPLLHEEDLFRLLEDLNNSPGLYQATACSIRVNNIDRRNFLTLGQHQTAACDFNWYTFNVNPAG